MPTPIAIIQGRHTIEFGKGKFDDWCVYLQKAGGARYAPGDIEYFTYLLQLGNRYGRQKVYTDFIHFYDKTTTQIDPSVITLITALAKEYGRDAEGTEIWFTVMYGGMVAEENKAFAILKKRIKRMGMHQILIEGMLPADAAQFSRGKPWRLLDALMKERGF